jgi:hypothetical protein
MFERQLTMQKSRRTAVYAVVTGLLTAGALTATMSVAHANVKGFCDGSGTAASCTVTQTIANPATIGESVTATPTQGEATVSWSVTCTLGTETATTSGGTMGETPESTLFTLPFADPDQCTATATVSVPTTTANEGITVAMTYTPATAAPSPSPSPTSTSTATGHVVRGFAGKCLDDAGNNAGNGAKVVIWTCNSNDKAQLWTYSSGELIHNGKCLNDNGWGGNRTKQVLYSCNRALNELYTHLASGEFVLNAKGYKLCLDDPANSKKNGTQVIVYTCKNSGNQHWQLP